MTKLPILIFLVVFALLMALTQFLTYQQYELIKEANRAELSHEATEAKDRFRNVLFNDIAAANTLAIIYKQYGVPANFDSVAHQIIKNSRYAEALQITENGIVKNVYPDTQYKTTIGTNVNADPVRKAEEDRAIKFKEIYFAGPRRLKFGDTGILGKVPIITSNKVVAVTTVLTRLPAIKKALIRPGTANRFTYELKDTHLKNRPFFLLSDAKSIAKSEYAEINIPEGDWLLRVSYAEGYTGVSFPVNLSIFGNGAPALIGTMVNINERKAIYNELLRSEANLKSMFDTTDVSFLLLDTDYKIIALNQQMKDMYIVAAGIELKAGAKLMELMPADKKAGAKAIYDKVIQSNSAINYETTYEGNARNVHFMANVKPIYDGIKVIGVCISALDITERKQMTIDLLSHVKAIEAQNTKLREIAWIQSHIVRAPLARLMGLIDLLKSCDYKEQGELLNYISISIDELDEVIKDITEKVYVNDDGSSQQV